MIDRTNYIFASRERGFKGTLKTRNAFTFGKECGPECLTELHLLNYLFCPLNGKASFARHLIGICD